MAKDFLLEVGIEEMPARFLGPALGQLKELAAKMLQEQRINCGDIATYGTPRRLVLHVKDVAERQSDLEKEVKGPAKKAAYDIDGNPTKAIQGFLKSQGVTIDDLVVRPIGQVEYLYAIKREEGRPAADVLAEITPAMITGLHFPKPMRWGSLEMRFARPIRWLVALYGEQVVPFELANLKSDRYTFGHRFLTTGGFEILNPEDYFNRIRAAYVLVDPAERKEIIWRQIQELAAAEGGRVEPDEDLLEEITNIIEWPTALCGSFDDNYLNLPEAVLVTPMREHQRYFPVMGEDGKLLNKFIAVRNGTSAHIEIVTAGNEKVLRARLADAAFFFDEDLKRPLAEKVEGLKKIVFLEGLGSIADKVDRIGALAEHISETMGANGVQAEQIQRAALLAKADLVTNMVYEFPELQGLMVESMLSATVKTRWWPRPYSNTICQDLPAINCLILWQEEALAWRTKWIPLWAASPLESSQQAHRTLCLRRQALGVCNIIIDGRLHISLDQIIEWAYQGYSEGVELKQELNQVKNEIQEFFKQRLRVY
ncbi:hypothetical protein N752_16070 [Desulforamulus aquiferis]|nr:hypothetical protein N752_16070 [Desulforamulus aquiferis]